MSKGITRSAKVADADLPRNVAEAEGFIASLFRGRGHYEKSETVSTLAEARERAKVLESDSPTGRKAMIYALHGGRQTFVPPTFGQAKISDGPTGLTKAIQESVAVEGLPASLDRRKNPVAPATAEERAEYAAMSKLTDELVATTAPDPVIEQIEDEQARKKKAKQNKRLARLATQQATRDIPDKYLAWDSRFGQFYDTRKGKPTKEGLMSALAKKKPNGKPKPAAKTAARRTKPARPEVAKAKPKASAPVKRTSLAERQAIEDAAAKGKLPPPPDFSADTHKPWRKKLEELVALSKKGDVKGLKTYWITDQKAPSTSPKALIRFRDLCVTALQARK